MDRQVPVIVIHSSSQDPARKQILDQIRSAIIEGQLRTGDNLPSVRRLAIDLGVHFNTVAEAYRSLAVEGWLDISHGRGATVIERAGQTAPDGVGQDQFRQRARHLVAEMRASGIPPRSIREIFLNVLEAIQ